MTQKSSFIKNTAIAVLAAVLIGTAAYVALKPKAIDQNLVAQILTGEQTSGTVSAENNQYVLTPGQTLTWLGRKPGGEHTGTIDLIDGYMNYSDGQIKGAEINFSVDSLTVSDIKDTAMNEKLVGHLKTKFFDTAKYPTGKFVFEQIVTSGTEMRAQGFLTLKDKTNKISFPITFQDKDNKVTIQTNFFIDRTQWGITEMAGAVDNFIGISFNLVWNKK